MASKKMLDELNNQIQEEIFSSYLYLSMATCFADKNLNGCAQWMTMQSQEEYAHAMKFYQYVLDIGGRVELQAIQKPEFEWPTALSMFEGALEHEKHVTGRINLLVDIAVEEKDHATNNFLAFFVGEQVEEEAAASEIVESFKMVGENTQGIYMLDKELGARQA